MIKPILTLFLGLMLLQNAWAEKADTTVLYYKNSGRRVDSKDSADFYRTILPPDTNGDKDLYRVYDYYFNGKIKSVGTSLTATANLVLDGTCIDYFQNGKRKRTCEYKNGRLKGAETNYYPNGNIYDILQIESYNDWYYDNYYRGYSTFSNYNVKILELRDSIGNLLATNGTGHVIIFDDDFKKILQEGNIVKNKKEGEWKGAIADSGRFVCNFHKGDLKSGTSYINSGNHYNFKQLVVRPVFSDGMDAFYLFIKKNVQYPESAKKHKVAGSVLVGFDVETNGTVSNVKVLEGIMKSVDDEAVRVISLSPLWVPGYAFGIPVKTHNRVSVNFYPY